MIEVMEFVLNSSLLVWSSCKIEKKKKCLSLVVWLLLLRSPFFTLLWCFVARTALETAALRILSSSSLVWFGLSCLNNNEAYTREFQEKIPQTTVGWKRLFAKGGADSRRFFCKHNVV